LVEPVVVQATISKPQPELRKLTRPSPVIRRLTAPTARKAPLPEPALDTVAPPAVTMAVAPTDPVPLHLPAPGLAAEAKHPSVLRRAIGTIPGLGFLKKKKRDAAAAVVQTTVRPRAVVQEP
jgi:hypothetical protein